MAEDIRITGENAQCDEARKRLLSTKEILAHILKACVEEYRDCDVRDIAGKYIEGPPEVGELSQGFEERGMKRGFEKGRVEGLTEGRIESTISTIRSLMGSMGWTMEQTMDAMQLPTADRPKYAEMLKLQRVRTFTENDIPNGSWQHEILTTSIGDIALVTRKP